MWDQGGDQGSSLDFCVCLLSHMFVVYLNFRKAENAEALRDHP